MFSTNKVEHLIVDTSAFIKNVPLQKVAVNVITEESVTAEVKSKRQLRRLIVLPYDLQVKDADPEHIKTVTEFAKKTGDYKSLSSTDIKVIALTLQLHIEKIGKDDITSAPTTAKTLPLKKSEPLAHPKCIAGFFNPKGGENSNNDSEDEDEDDDDDDDDDNDDYKDQDEDEDSDEAGWITPSNIVKAKKMMDADTLSEESVKVACMTTDFAMQNVLMQMGMHVAALDGRVIKQLRTFIFRCHACYKKTSRMDLVFCPNCGLKTLKKVAVSVDENGVEHIHINYKKQLPVRGKRFSLPTPKGGKHAVNPILSADQPVPDQRVSKLARMKNNPLNDDYIAGYSPFVTRDVFSKSAMLGIRSNHAGHKYWMKKNPNECKKKRK
ncbi:RNA-binding protein NOB1 isoform X3 [Cotesia glomerata]|uniref:RNA-binding protein NOB1 isoform X3 n=1 Tax=Cotesia glomerata TaxID=32391 RepID=UPI001D00D242|nr:RNA-binding protein NOB1 isoform X3 [Cotesia glomerata]